ncbi:hypothetical protein [Prosthecobacter sp.]|uniref:hypothetical protein n=1 Tax=Prosthecobacter sp. TaxID=1965333 RepID=UPI001E146C12|nr:hypothetical protein [Prosthecobacter sp.]MCB1279223.1 hypothetical protein [Prosthecobacter sp.]
MKTISLLITAVTFTCVAFAQEGKENPKQALQSLMERARDAKAAGRLDEAKELAAQAERFQAELREREGMKKPEKHMDKKGPMPGKGPEAERMEHVMQAIQHLHAAGLHEPAKGIEEIAQHLRREMEERMHREQAEAREREGKNHGEMRAQAELNEMRQQMRRMAEVIEQLQAELRKRDPDKFQPLAK